MLDNSLTGSSDDNQSLDISKEVEHYPLTDDQLGRMT